MITLRSKTLTASLDRDIRAVFDWISDPVNLTQWYKPLARFAPIRFVREDRAFLLDLVLTVKGAEVRIAIRLLANGDGTEVVLTLVQPRDLPAAEFQDLARWAGSALSDLKKIPKIAAEAASAAGEPASLEVGPSTIDSQEGGPSPLEAGSEAPLSGKRLFVGNLPFAWTEDQLRELFAAHGTVTHAAIPRLRGRHGRSRGFGFIEMSTEAETQIAIEKLHDGLAGERKIIVRLAHAKESRANTSTSPADSQVALEEGKSPARHRAGRNRRPASDRPRNTAGSRLPRKDADRSDRAPRRTGISNSHGYEIYPRTKEGGFASEPTARSAAEPQAAHPGDASPYFEDTGDTENRGNRNPRRR